MPQAKGTKIRILDTDEEIGREFMDCLLRRNLPSKFEYWGKRETRNWLTLCRDPEYVNWPHEINLLRRNLPSIVKTVGPQTGNLIGLGIGNGEKDKIILKEFLKTRPMRYFALDISLDMMKTGINTLRGTPVEKNAYIGDFRHLKTLAPEIRKQTGSANLYSLLGNTLGNLNQKETLALLKKVMDKKDHLLFAVQMLETKEIINMGEILSAYSTRTWRNLTFGAIMRTGIKMRDGMIEMEFGRDELYPNFHIVRYFFTFKKDVTVKYMKRKLHFKTDERIPVYFSYKYDEKNITFLLNNNGFKIVKSFLAPGKKYLLALAKLK